MSDDPTDPIQPTAAPARPTPAAAPAGPPPWLMGLLFALAFGLWRFPVLHQPPVWDGAMGMTPAAITLESLNFDIGALLAMPDYRAGGPNLHSLSLFTWTVAGAIRVFGDYQTALPFLHLLSFVLMGVLGAGVYRLLRSQIDDVRLAALATTAVLVFPPLAVQGSDVYLDLPLAVAATWSLIFCFENRWAAAAIAACIAAAIKPTAIVLVPALIVCAFLAKGGWKQVARRGALALAPAVVAVLPLLMDRALRQPDPRGEWTVAVITQRTLGYLGQMPVFLVVVLALVLVYLIGMRQGKVDGQTRAVLVGTLTLLVSYVAFFCLSPLASKGIQGLPRYVTLVAPAVCGALTLGTVRIWGSRGGWTCAASLLGVFLLNLYGALEPRSGNLYPLAERSLAYEKLLEVQKQSLTRFSDLAETMPSYYDHFTYYRFSYPDEGWTAATPVDGTPTWIRPGDPVASLDDKPDRFAMLFEAPWLGGHELALIYQQAVASPDWSVDTETFEEGDFTNHVIVVTRVAQ